MSIRSVQITRKELVSLIMIASRDTPLPVSYGHCGSVRLHVDRAAPPILKRLAELRGIKEGDHE